MVSRVNGQGKWRPTYRDYSNESNNEYKFKDTVCGEIIFLDLNFVINRLLSQ